VHVQVLGEGLAPGVQHEAGGDLAAEPARVGAELEQGVGGGGEEHRVDHSRVALGEGIEFMRKGEHQVEVGHG